MVRPVGKWVQLLGVLLAAGAAAVLTGSAWPVLAGGLFLVAAPDVPTAVAVTVTLRHRRAAARVARADELARRRRAA